MTLIVLLALVAVWLAAWRIFVVRPGGTVVLNALLPVLVLVGAIVIGLSL